MRGFETNSRKWKRGRGKNAGTRLCCQYTELVLGAWKCKKVSQTAAGTLPLFDMHFHAWIDTSVWTIIFQHSVPLAVHFRGSISRYSTRGMHGIRLDFLPGTRTIWLSWLSRVVEISFLDSLPVRGNRMLCASILGQVVKKFSKLKRCCNRNSIFV